MVKFYKDSKGEYRWQAKAKNGKILADSAEGYKDLRDAELGALKAAVELFNGPFKVA